MKVVFTFVLRKRFIRQAGSPSRGSTDKFASKNYTNKCFPEQIIYLRRMEMDRSRLSVQQWHPSRLLYATEHSRTLLPRDKGEDHLA